MTKDWEEEVQNPNYKDTPLRKVLKKLYADGWEASSSTDNGDRVEAYVIAEEEVLKILAKQRTQFLARVREEVIGKDEKWNKSIQDWRIEIRTQRNNLRFEQLKKLEIISEEVKE